MFRQANISCTPIRRTWRVLGLRLRTPSRLRRAKTFRFQRMRPRHLPHSNCRQFHLGASMKLVQLVIIGVLAVLLISCGKKDELLRREASSVSSAAPIHDVGKLDTVMVTTQGSGATASEAATEAV